MISSEQIFFNNYEAAKEFASLAGQKLKRVVDYEWNKKRSGLWVLRPANLSKAQKQIFDDLWTSLSREKFPLNEFAASVFILMADSVPGSLDVDPLVLEAFRRNFSDLSAATETEIGDYLRSLSVEQLGGVINNAKGTFHELSFAKNENLNGDQWYAELMPATNHPGSDIVLTNIQSNEQVELQLKATDSISYIQEHFERYPDIGIAATEEVAHALNITSTGFTNEEITNQVKDDVQKLISDGQIDISDVVTNSIEGGLLGATFNAAEEVNEKGFNALLDDKETRARILKGLRVAATLTLFGSVF